MPSTTGHGFAHGLRAAARDILGRPVLYWVVAGLFATRVLVLTLLTPRRPDTEGMWQGARAYLADPRHMYEAAAAYLARTHVIAPPGGLDAFVSPPPVALLAMPVALLPEGIAVEAWTLLDAVALVAGLVVLYRVAAPSHPLARPAFWLAAAYFPPLFADVSAGQRGGVALLFAASSIALEASRPSWAGFLAGLAGALKYYPAAMGIGPRPQHRLRYALAIGITIAGVTALSFVPLGPAGAAFYYQHVLIPSLASHNPDCAYDSVRTLFMRSIGGEPFLIIASGRVTQVTSPIDLPVLGLVISYLSAPAFGLAALWAAWRSGWNAPYGMALGFALGAVIPNEVWPYQWLPLLPLLLLTGVRAIEQGRRRTLLILGVLMLGFFRQPCDLLFPNLWTIAGIAIFVVGVWENRLFRTAPQGG